jgi:hypothetical protein
MRWFGRRQVDQDPGRRQALVQDARQRFGAHIQAPFADQARALVPLLDGDDGLGAAAEILREFADSAHTELQTQAADLARRFGQALAVDRRNYRPLWKAAGPYLRWPLFVLPCGLQPYVHVAAAVTVIGTHARRSVRVTEPQPLLTDLFEVLDLTLAGWEFGRVQVDTDAASLATGLITAARDLRAEMGDPPPLPPPVRELMRRNNTVDVVDPSGRHLAGSFNPGKQMREFLLA